MPVAGSGGPFRKGLTVGHLGQRLGEGPGEDGVLQYPGVGIFPHRLRQLGRRGVSADEFVNEPTQVGGVGAGVLRKQALEVRDRVGKGCGGYGQGGGFPFVVRPYIAYRGGAGFKLLV
jgi:hypothetical protein